MTIRHMRIFAAVCDHGCNTTRAAEALHMTQPAVSLAIRELEEYYGVSLFDRLGRRLKLTGAGEQFLSYARRIGSLFTDMEFMVKNYDSFGLLRVGASITIGAQLLPHYVRTFCDRYPGTRIRATVAPTSQLEEMLLNNQLDLALIEGAVHSHDLVSEPYLEDTLIMICPPEFGFVPGQRLSLEEFRAQTFLLREKGSGTREALDLATERAGFTLEPAWEAVSTTALVSAVISGLGCAVLPRRMLLGPIVKRLVVPVTVDALDFTRCFQIVYHREKLLTTAARTFLDLCRSYEDDYPLPPLVDLTV